jgi:Na+-transporting NADH:ubiquinone oxidoreductase subunit NqrC
MNRDQQIHDMERDIFIDNAIKTKKKFSDSYQQQVINTICIILIIFIIYYFVVSLIKPTLKGVWVDSQGEKHTISQSMYNTSFILDNQIGVIRDDDYYTNQVIHPFYGIGYWNQEHSQIKWAKYGVWNRANRTKK